MGFQKIPVYTQGTYHRRFLIIRQNCGFGPVGVFDTLKLNVLRTLIKLCQSIAGFFILAKNHCNSVLSTKEKFRPKLGPGKWLETHGQRWYGCLQLGGKISVK